MKKFTFIIAAMLICGVIFAQQVKFAPLSAVKSNSEVKVQFDNHGSAKVDTDTLYNFNLSTATLTNYGFGPTVWGSWTGHNEYGWSMFAEKFTTPAAGDLNGFIYIPFAVYDAGSGVVNFKVWDDNAGMPGTELASVAVNIADMTAQTPHNIDLASPIAVDGVFYCGYEITYNTPVDTFNMVQTQTSAINTFMFYDGIDWSDMPTATSGGITGSNLAIGARVNIVMTEPLAEVNPTLWAAGGVEIGSDLVSGTFTLKNTGIGTLTATGISGLAAPFTSTFVAGDVSLAAGETYTFTFTFAPTTSGAAANTVQIATNGGTVSINLTGTGNTPVTGDMDGGFENNVNDFDLAFTGWTQHDMDESTTYGIVGVAFANAYYTGSFIAFNPATTSPALGVEWAPNNGDRFGACFAATTGPTTPNNDWLITPQTDVINTGAKFQAYVQSITGEYGLERYAIWVSTTDNQIASFTKISDGTHVEAPTGGWVMIEYPLEAYVGEQIYVAIQCVSSDAFAFMIDDIVIDNPVNVENNIAAAISVFPNPANNVITVANAENENIVVLNMLGEVVANISNASSNQTIDISNLSNGTYFVRVNSEVFKINIVK
ncbi:MAG: choice-of-anchor J domain-containing protein [Bacteroidales bacterium]|nr:choice-of-anchor J domain-containing protein [Bacteroidales bacterium]